MNHEWLYMKRDVFYFTVKSGAPGNMSPPVAPPNSLQQTQQLAKLRNLPSPQGMSCALQQAPLVANNTMGYVPGPGFGYPQGNFQQYPVQPYPGYWPQMNQYPQPYPQMFPQPFIYPMQMHNSFPNAPTNNNTYNGKNNNPGK